MALRNPRLETVGDGFRVIVPYRYSWTVDGTQYRLTVPSGVRPDGKPWNGCSSPRILWPLLGRDGKRHRGAWLLHDFLYFHGGEVGSLHERLDVMANTPRFWVEVGTPWTREQADRLFLRLCREGGVSRWIRRLAYRAISWFGGSSWRGASDRVARRGS